jgi:hypothetical protein
MEQVVERDWKKVGAKLSNAEAKGRLDIRVVTSAGQQVIIELKRGTLKPRFGILNQQMLKYHQALKKVLLAKLNDPNPSIRVIAIVGTRPDDVDVPTQERTLDAINGEIITYDELISNARDSYHQYLEASTRASRLNRILAQITEGLDDDGE